MASSLERPLDGVGFGEPTNRKLTSCWLEQPTELREGPGVLFHCGAPREWGILPYGKEFKF